MTVVYSTVRTLNLAHGDLFALTTAVLTTVLISLGVQATWLPLMLIGVLAVALLGAIAIGAGLNVWLIRSRTGRAWLASSQDKLAAASSGINVARCRLLAFVLSSALAGALYASNFAYVSPDMVSFNVTTMTLTMVVLGGAGSVPGVILGAILVIGYDKLFIPRLAAWVAQLQPSGTRIGSVPDVRGTSFFNFGLALYLTALWRGRRREKE